MNCVESFPFSFPVTLAEIPYLKSILPLGKYKSDGFEKYERTSPFNLNQYLVYVGLCFPHFAKYPDLMTSFYEDVSFSNTNQGNVTYRFPRQICIKTYMSSSDVHIAL